MLSSSIWHQNNLICSVEFWQQIMAELPVEFSTGSNLPPRLWIHTAWFFTPWCCEASPSEKWNRFWLCFNCQSDIARYLQWFSKILQWCHQIFQAHWVWAQILWIRWGQHSWNEFFSCAHLTSTNDFNPGNKCSFQTMVSKDQRLSCFARFNIQRTGYCGYSDMSLSSQNTDASMRDCIMSVVVDRALSL